MRMLPGIWLVQALTAAIVWLAASFTGAWQVALSVVLAAGVGALAAVWLSGTVRDQRRILEARHAEVLARKTAELSGELARQKTADANRLAGLAQKAGRTGLLRTGLVTGGIVGMGAAFLLAQVFAVGAIALAFGAGGLAGYQIRARAKQKPIGLAKAQAPMIEIGALSR